jgi:hypothetical protein
MPVYASSIGVGQSERRACQQLVVALTIAIVFTNT